MRFINTKTLIADLTQMDLKAHGLSIDVYATARNYNQLLDLGLTDNEVNLIAHGIKENI